MYSFPPIFIAPYILFTTTISYLRSCSSLSFVRLVVSVAYVPTGGNAVIRTSNFVDPLILFALYDEFVLVKCLVACLYSLRDFCSPVASVTESYTKHLKLFTASKL